MIEINKIKVTITKELVIHPSELGIPCNVGTDQMMEMISGNPKMESMLFGEESDAKVVYEVYNSSGDSGRLERVTRGKRSINTEAF